VAEAAAAPKRALVTGAGVRLGKAMALLLGTRGYQVVVHARNSRKEAEAVADTIGKQGGQARVLCGDLAIQDDLDRITADAWNAFGGLDVLINNAAIFWPTALESLDGAALDPFLAVNLRAPFHLASVLGRRMKAAGGGQIVNLACPSGSRPWVEYVPYSISKAGVVSMTEGLARLLGPEVRVNALAPGTVLPPEGMRAEDLERQRERAALKRLGRPEDILGALQYLLDAEFVTGQVVTVDGGRHLS
jgi:NAD(P)-dependent dehydrogenase (short-subunit alcohol dehydrogenase family)